MNDREHPSSPETARSSPNASFYRFEFIQAKGRVHAKYSGTWTEQVARDALDALRAALASAKAQGRSLTLLDDFRAWKVQTPEVTNIANRFEEVCRGFPVSRNAMVIPDAAVRRQVRRTLTDFRVCSIFETIEDADRWLAEVE